jgi:RNA polymerase sigma-70 factor, ECF subfamily
MALRLVEPGDTRTVRGPDKEAGAGEPAGGVGLEAALASDLEGSFERLVRVYQDRLFAFALRLAGRREDAEEIAQDAFVRAYRALTTYPAERIRTLALRAWLYRIALNVARNRFRRKRHPVVSIDHGVVGPDGAERAPLELAADADERPDRVYEKRRARSDVATLVRSLPERYRAPILLRYVEGLPVEEVASVLQQPVGTAKSNLHRAVNKLRESLSESRRGTKSGARPRSLPLPQEVCR